MILAHLLKRFFCLLSTLNFPSFVSLLLRQQPLHRHKYVDGGKSIFRKYHYKHRRYQNRSFRLLFLHKKQCATKHRPVLFSLPANRYPKWHRPIHKFPQWSNVAEFTSFAFCPMGIARAVRSLWSIIYRRILVGFLGNFSSFNVSSFRFLISLFSFLFSLFSVQSK